MFCNCLGPDRRPNVVPLEEKSQREDKKAREFLITAVALAMLTLLSVGAAYILFGIGTMPETMMIGFGIVPSLTGTFLTYLGMGLGISAFGFGVLGGYQSYRHHTGKVEEKSGKNNPFENTI